MSKLLYTITFIFITVISANAQFTFSRMGDSIAVRTLSENGVDIEFHLNLENNSGSDLQLRWRIMANDFPSSSWEDYMCDEICYTSAKRFKDWDMPSTMSSFQMIHHIRMYQTPGYGWSQVCMFDRNDSANTLQCVKVKAATSPYLITDSMFVEQNGETYLVLAGVVYEKSGSGWVMYSNAGHTTIEELEDSLIYINDIVYRFLNDGWQEYGVLGADDIAHEDIGLTVYPNPSTGWITFSAKPGKNVVLTVYDLTGREVLSKTLTDFAKHQVYIDSPGLYFATVQYEDGTSHAVNFTVTKQ
ncbi:MAG: hypothetical protein Kow0075_07570 [Salibacteraceae bacterium]